MIFGGEELYPSLAQKASVLGFIIIRSHPFIDGNKRTGHAAIVLNFGEADTVRIMEVGSVG